MYLPDHFDLGPQEDVFNAIDAAPFANLVTITDQGPFSTPLPLYLDREEEPHGVLYGHIARANPQWKTAVHGTALAIFMGPDAYVSPSFYPTKQETGKVVPTWNYVTVQARGPVEFFTDQDRLRDVVNKLTDLQETGRSSPWKVSDAPDRFVEVQLRGIVGVRLPIAQLFGKAKLSQNKAGTDYSGVVTGLSASADPKETQVGRAMEKLSRN
ncbi:PaiB family negative transcriptional regulator [Roseibium hamelinense]|uniref:PaiB family negative transcriptional regulator n=1 Tax=Roseibium hamelinense TaxID=150831 RepID=A0A562TIA3_9HYPH|nr:FMN-binding negative transcriptional regulator [Roseibium hamelinense]MTI45824.1 FMN-binding negative transcriptional regulator [Roseibium hamelinense]TWI92994.1 PaiB family negative transcriptional regulator [Roseibium hamelinense]